jgi:cytochrome c oxidase subunit 4
MATPPKSNERHREHPNEGVYFSVFIALAVLTVAEVLVTYVPGLNTFLLLFLMSVKAWLVVQFFMHLRYDSKIYSWTFVIPIIIGALAILIVPFLSL